MKTIGIYAKKIEKKDFEHLISIIEHINNRNSKVLIYKDVFDELKENNLIKIPIDFFETSKDLREKADFLLSLGGDGTMLSAVTLIEDSGIPVLGFNFGRLGFLTNSNTTDIQKAIDSLFSNNFTLSKRSLLKLKTLNNKNIEHKLNFALNDISITKKDSNSMILIHTFINNNILHSLWADGIIISTPTGSTAYSLSCNGPIVTPDCQNFIITPIAPHNLSVRPVVIPNNTQIKLIVESKYNSKFNLTLDSCTYSIKTLTEISIEKENFEINLVNLEQTNFLQTIRDKLNWGIDKRN